MDKNNPLEMLDFDWFESIYVIFTIFTLLYIHSSSHPPSPIIQSIPVVDFCCSYFVGMFGTSNANGFLCVIDIVYVYIRTEQNDKKSKQLLWIWKTNYDEVGLTAIFVPTTTIKYE